MLQKSPHRSRNAEVTDFVMPFWPGWSANMWLPMLNAMIAWNWRAGSAVAAINGECLDLVSRRTKEDFGLAQRLGASRGPDDVWQAYSEFLLKAANDYQKEFAELARLGSTAAAEGAAAMQACAQGASHETQPASLAA